MAAAYSDPIAHIRAQDESQYVHASVQIADDGGWLTPKLLGRFYLLKPPFLMWATAVSLRIFGENAVAIRLPALVMGAFGCCAVFLWAARGRSIAAGILAAGVLLLNPLWGLLSRLCYTDTLSASFSALALLMPAMDPGLERPRTRLLFGLFAGAAILDKGIAGLIPCLALMLFALIAWSRPVSAGPGSAMLVALRARYVLESLAVAALVAGPWHLYQLLVHRDWFLAEYVQTQIVASGVFGTEAGIFNRPAFFYLERLAQLDPILVLLTLMTVGGIFQVLRKRKDPAALLAVCWLLTAAVALALFQVRNLPYLALALVPVSLVGAVCAGTWVDKFGVRRITILLVAALAVKAGIPSQNWSLRPASAPLPGAEAIRAYHQMHRNTELIDVNPDDEYYSCTVPLTKIRYIYLDPVGSVARSAPHNAYLGITLDSHQFLNLPQLEPQFEKRLRAWGLDSAEPVGTTITLHAIPDLSQIISERPRSDFYLPDSWLPPAASWNGTHQLMHISSGRVLLLSKTAENSAGSLTRLPAW